MVCLVKVDPFAALTNSAGVRIRQAKKPDMPAIEELVASLFQRTTVKNIEDDLYVVAEKGGEIIGFCHFRLRSKTGYIVGLGVLPEFRKHGIGTMMMAKALEVMDKNGAQTTMLKVRALNAAASLYAKFGFFEKKYGEVLLLVRKRPS